MTSRPIYLCLMRHAKSSWSDGSLTDHQRPLNDRGRAAAELIGGVLSVRGYAPDAIWCSDAKRTRETAMKLIRAIPGAQQVLYNPLFYHASPQDVFSVCDGLPAPTQNLMLLGHNPGWGELFTHFSEYDHDFPTAACAVFEAKALPVTNWFRPHHWKFVDLLLPRSLA